MAARKRSRPRRRRSRSCKRRRSWPICPTSRARSTYYGRSRVAGGNHEHYAEINPMRLVIVVIGALLAAILVTLYALDNPGYVLIARAPWSVEMTLTTFVLLALLGAGALYLAVYLVVRLVR